MGYAARIFMADRRVQTLMQHEDTGQATALFHTIAHDAYCNGGQQRKSELLFSVAADRHNQDALLSNLERRRLASD